MFIYGTFSNSNYQINTCSDDAQRKNLNFNVIQNKTLDVKFATSYISVEQAKRNLQLEVLDKNYSFNDLQQETRNI
jgi:putative alpha-1,2-mannosidase